VEHEGRVFPASLIPAEAIGKRDVVIVVKNPCFRIEGKKTIIEAEREKMGSKLLRQVGRLFGQEWGRRPKTEITVSRLYFERGYGMAILKD
jgi:hypothetical protein